jgi:flagellar biosynthesis chaperone FliJ
MRPFTFRAQAALELRRRQHDEALRQRATAFVALVSADAAVTAAQDAIAAADRERAALMQGAVEYVRVQWHQAYRLRCLEERTQLQARRTQRDQELQQATQHVSQTHRRLRSLERLREHALTAWMRAAQQDEQKTMDALAASRFVQEEMR